MFWSVFSFEIRYRLRRPATYIYFVVFLVLTALIVANGGTPASEKVHHNSPAMIGSFFALLGIFSVLIGSAVMGAPLYRDLEHGTKEYLLSTPMRKSAYFWGRFWGSFFILLLIMTGAIFGFILGSWLGPLFDWTKAERYGPNHLSYYLWAFVTVLLPSAFFVSCIFYALVAWLRNNRVLYSASILLFILYLLANFLTQDLENRNLVDLMDPFAVNTYTNAIKYLTPAEQNTILTPLTGNLLLNRLLWPAAGLLLIVLSYLRFSIQRFVSAPDRGAKKRSEAPAPAFSGKLPLQKGSFSTALNWRNLRGLGRLEFLNILRDPYFISILLGAVVFLFLDDWIGNQTYGVGDRPLTMNMLLFKTFNYNIFVFILLMFYAGETVHRDRATRFANIADALPVPDWVQLGSKFIAISGVCLMLATLPMLVGLCVQILKGYFNFKFGFYLTDLYLITFWDYWQMALLAFFVHVLVNQKFVGHFAGIAVWVLMFVLRNFLEQDYNLFFYSYKPGYLVSDMNGFGHFGAPLFWFNLYWTAFGFILLLFASLWWTRGAAGDLTSRWRNFRQRFSLSHSVGLAGLGLLWLGAGACIYYNVSVLNKYRSGKEGERWQAAYEKRYKKYERIPQPKITAVKLYADIFPEQREMALRADLMIVNKSDAAIDTLHLLSEDGQRYSLRYNGAPLMCSAYDLMPRPKFTFWYPQPDTGGYRRFALPAPLAPGDTARLEFSTTLRNPGFVNDGYRRDIVYNGTFSSSGLPSIGYDANLELNGDEDRKKQGLPEKPEDLPPHRDPYGEKTLLFSDDADLVNFECVLSTTPDQIAVAPGYLQKEWTENGRRYFHYVQDSKIQYFFSVVSGRFAVLRDVWTGPDGRQVNLEIFYHHEHNFNLDRYMAALKDGLSYFHQHFGPYQFRQLRVLEFPRYAAFAQSFPNTVPYSEDFGWFADFSDPNKYDYAYYVTAHELAHQWWGHQVTPNYTRGSNLISESLAEYSALMIAEQRYGSDNLQKFLKYDLDRYLRGRANESKKENTFINCNRPYQWYQKGSLILYALRDYIGEEQLNQAIRSFRNDFALREAPPYPGSYDLYAYIEKAVPDSLRYFLEDSWLKLALYENRVMTADAKDLGGDRYEVTLRVKARKMYADDKGNESEATEMNDYIDIGIFAEDEKSPDGRNLTRPLYLQKHRLKNGEHSIVLTVTGKPLRAGIDPYNKLIDRVPEDNRMPVSL